MVRSVIPEVASTILFFIPHKYSRPETLSEPENAHSKANSATFKTATDASRPCCGRSFLKEVGREGNGLGIRCAGTSANCLGRGYRNFLFLLTLSYSSVSLPMEGSAQIGSIWPPKVHWAKKPVSDDPVGGCPCPLR
jgi:hypothetical protein